MPGLPVVLRKEKTDLFDQKYEKETLVLIVSTFLILL